MATKVKAFRFTDDELQAMEILAGGMDVTKWFRDVLHNQIILKLWQDPERPYPTQLLRGAPLSYVLDVFRSWLNAREGEMIEGGNWVNDKRPPHEEYKGKRYRFSTTVIDGKTYFLPVPIDEEGGK